jgi:hypothetical protein
MGIICSSGFSVLASFCFSIGCFAQVVISFFPNGIRSDVTLSANQSADLQAIDAAITRVNIVGSSTTDVGRISLDPGNRATPLEIVLGVGPLAANPDIPFVPVFANNFAGLSIPPGREQYVLYSGGIAGNLTGSLHVGRIVRLQVGGAVQADVSAITNGPAGQATIAATSNASRWSLM